MKFIGQFIQDFIARFRNDVYLEDLTESAQDHVVGIDADGKLYKQDVSTGDITGVTITTDSGGGSKAEDTSGSADFSILGSSGVNVTNSGTTITAVSVPGEIDHDSLLNFVAAEHYRWDTDISSTATIHTNNITDLHGAGVSGSANQLLTDDGSGGVTSESEAQIVTEGGSISQFLKNAGSNSVLTGTNTSGDFTAYKDLIFYDPSNGSTDTIGMEVSLGKALDGDFGNGTLTQKGGKFTSFDFGNNTGATVNLMGLDVGVTGNTLGGTSSGVGIDISVVNNNVNDGIAITTTNGSASTGHDIKITSSLDTADFFGIRTFGSGETEITTVDSDGANAAHLKIDIDGDITLDSVTGNIVGQTNGSDYTPTADAHLATKKYVDDNTSVSIRSFIDLRKDDLYIQFMSQQNRWYGTGRAGSSIAVASTLDGVSVSNTITISNGAFTATRNCTLHSVQITFAPTQTHDYEFEILKVPYVDDSTAVVTLAKMTHTNHNANYTANRTYTKHFDITGGNTLTVGQGIIFALRRTSAGSTPFVNGMLIGEIEIT